MAKNKDKKPEPEFELFEEVLGKFQTKVIDGKIYSCLEDKPGEAAVADLFLFIKKGVLKIEEDKRKQILDK